MDKQVNILSTDIEFNVNANFLRDLLDSEVILVGGGEVQANGY